MNAKPLLLDLSGFIARRVAFNRQHSFSRFIIRLAVAATAISVMAMILTFAFTKGFQYAIASKMYGFSGHIRVQHYESEGGGIAEDKPVLVNDTVLKVLKNDPDVISVNAFATKDAILKGPESFQGLKLKGVAQGYAFSNIGPFLQSGTWPHLRDSGYSNEIMISSYTASLLKLKPGDRFFTYFIQPDGSKRVRPMVVSGIYKTGMENFDRIVAIVDLRLIQRLNNWGPDQIGGYEVYIRNVDLADSVSSRIYQALPSKWTSRSIMEIYGNIFDWLNLMDTTIIITIVIMSLVAVLNLVTCLIILLLERTHMIGLLKSLGSGNRMIQKVFLYHGALITFGGLIIGNLAALLVCWLQNRYGFIRLPEETYFISVAAVKISWQQILWINLGTFLVCYAVLLLPSFYIVHRLSPVKAIAFD